MRFLIKASIQTKVGNAKTKDDTISKTTQAILNLAKPEAVYFTAADGVRTTYTVVNVRDASELSSILEAWYLGFEANLEVHFACTPDDVAMSAPRIQEIVAKF
jgi:hypothetical protein